MFHIGIEVRVMRARHRARALVDEEKRIVDRMFLDEFGKGQPGRHGGSRREQSDEE